MIQELNSYAWPSQREEQTPLKQMLVRTAAQAVLRPGAMLGEAGQNTSPLSAYTCSALWKPATNRAAQLFFFCKMTAHTISCWEKYGMLGKCKQKLSFTRALSRTWSKGQEAPPGPSPSSLRHKNIRNPQHNLLRKHRPSSRAPRGGFLNLCIDGIRSEKTEVGKDVVHYLIRQCFLQLSPYIPGIVF